MAYGVFSRHILLTRSPNPPAFVSALIVIGEDSILEVIEVPLQETVTF